MKSDRRWWNDGRYEQECAAFDAEQPLSRVTWESLQRIRREQAIQDACQPIFPRYDWINARTESGVEVRIKLRLDFPMHCGVAYL